MKRTIASLALALAAVVAASAAERAPITITVQSYRSLSNIVSKVVEAVAPGSSAPLLDDLREGLGLSELAGVDLDRPWQLGVWVEGTAGAPSLSLWIPTTDYADFKDGLDEGGALQAASDQTEMRNAGGYAGIWIEQGLPSEQARTAHATWQARDIGTPDGAFALDIVPGEPLRQQLLGGLAMVKMTVVGTMAQQGESIPGVDAQAMANLMGVYFDVLDVFLKGLDRFHLGLTLKGEALAIDKVVRAKPDSELAAWLTSKPGDLKSVLPYAQGDEPLAFAMRWEQSPAIMPTLKKFMSLSMEMQGMAADSQAIKDTEALIEQMLPLKAAGTLGFNDGFAFSGVYQFPGRDTKGVYDLIRNYIENSMQGQVGEGKPYSSMSFIEDQRQVAGLQVDQATMAFNLDAPLYQMPGQKEMIESMWPGGKMVFDYVLQGENLFISAPEQLEGLLKRSTTAVDPVGSLTPNTVAYGRMNLLQFIPTFLETNPMVPQEAKDKLQDLETSGTDITFQVDVGEGMAGSGALLPIKFLESIGAIMQ